MIMYKCADPQCRGLWKEADINFKRIRDYDPEGDWRYKPTCPACGADAVEVNVCPICKEIINWKASFCDDCIEDGARQVRSFIEDLYVRGNDISDLDDLTREDYFNHILEKA